MSQKSHKMVSVLSFFSYVYRVTNSTSQSEKLIQQKRDSGLKCLIGSRRQESVNRLDLYGYQKLDELG
jgi:hypothetical protein